MSQKVIIMKFCVHLSFAKVQPPKIYRLKWLNNKRQRNNTCKQNKIHVLLSNRAWCVVQQLLHTHWLMMIFHSRLLRNVVRLKNYQSILGYETHYIWFMHASPNQPD